MDLSEIEAIFFDLDETLLIMDHSVFRGKLLTLMNKQFNLSFDHFDKMYSRTMTEVIARKETKYLVYDDFCQKLGQRLSLTSEEVANKFQQFYLHDFDRLKSLVIGQDIAAKLIQKAKSKYKIFLTTNPITPRMGTEGRMKWINLKFDDFEFISTGDNFHFFKPDPKYFELFLEKAQVPPEHVLMVGNDLLHDAAASELGIKTWIINDYPEFMREKERGKYKVDHESTLQELYNVL